MNSENQEWKLRLLGFGFLVALFGSMYLYVREFPVFSNTIGVPRLLLGAVLVAALLAAGIVYGFRERLLPWQKHWPELVFLVFPMLFFAPLIGSLLNRAGGSEAQRSFAFVSEQAFVASGYGILKGETVKPTHYLLTVRDEQGKFYTFKYKQQAYYPITKPGDAILLPVKKGLFGFEIVQLK